MKERAIREKPRTFESFPEDSTCPVCLTNDDGETLLIPKVGTQEGTIYEAVPVHLSCAIPEYFDDDYKIMYRRTFNTSEGPE